MADKTHTSSLLKYLALLSPFSPTTMAAALFCYDPPSHLGFLLLFLLLSPRVCSFSFQINDFDSNADMVYRGHTEPLKGSIRFSEGVGWASYAKKLLLWDRINGDFSDFRTHFSFVINSTSSNSSAYHGHGLTFFLAPVGFHPPLNSSGGFLGLFNTTENGPSSFQTQIVHVEFDTFPNPEWDPPFQHVGINQHSIVSSVYSPWNASRSHNGEKIDVWISYNAAAKNLSVSWTYDGRQQTASNATLFHQIDLMKVLPENVTIGFSVSSVDHHQVQNLSIEFWEFSSTLDANDEEDDTHAAETEKSINTNLVAVLIAWVAVFTIAIAIIFLISLTRSREEKKHEVMKLASIYTDLNKEASSPRRFSYRYLAMATDNFSIDRKLGQGGFGAVFEGHLPGANKTVAVKKISKTSTQGKREYVSEVKIISRMRHQNLVQLIGWCHEGDESDKEFLLVYQFMPNGSLDSHLFGKSPPLPWPLRYKIAFELAAALLYLQEHRVVHRDIKTSNVLLDSDFSAKLGDFGLARLVENELNSKTTGLAGTFGYMAPEYISSGRAGKESDIFSYGVVVLEIVSGRRCSDHSGKGLIEWVWDVYGRGEVVKALDGELRESFEAREVERLSVVGLWCAHPDATQRPSIKQAIEVLKFKETVPNLPPRMPVPTFNNASIKFPRLSVVCPDTTCSSF